jgi:mannose-6-phosphate isomerase-like protein (cupin superfamily)
VSYTVLNKADLPFVENAHEFQGYPYGGTNISLILVDMPPGKGPLLHSHPYEEIFIVQEGRVTFTVDSTTLEARAGQIVIVPPGVPHKFVNSGQANLRQIDIHASSRFITDWLEDEKA